MVFVKFKHIENLMHKTLHRVFGKLCRVFCVNELTNIPLYVADCGQELTVRLKQPCRA